MPENMSIGEISLIAVVAVGAVVGLFRGFSGGLASLCGIAAALAAGMFLFDPVTALIAERGWFSGELERNAAAIVAVGVACLLSFGIVRRLVERFVRYLVPRTLDALLGGAVGGVIGFTAWRAARWAIDMYLQGGEALQETAAA